MTYIRGPDLDNDTEYKIIWEYITTLAERRQHVTTIFLSANTAIIGAIAFLLNSTPNDVRAQRISILILLISGIIACDLWRRLINQYSLLSSWWYEKLREIENTIPNCTKIINLEYLELYNVPTKKKRIGMTRYEIRLTILVMSLYGAFTLAIIYSMISK